MSRHRSASRLSWLPRLTRLQAAALALTAAGAATVVVASVVAYDGQPESRGIVTITVTTPEPTARSGPIGPVFPPDIAETVARIETETAATAAAPTAVPERTADRCDRCGPRTPITTTPAPTATTPPPDPDPQPADGLLELVNRDRHTHGCAPVTAHPDLTAQSQAHADHQAAQDTMHHSDGVAGFDAWGENVAAGYPTPAAVHDAWMSSPGHRANILRCDYTHIGWGVADSPDGTRYWTQQFAA